jgi:Methyltransferase domain
MDARRLSRASKRVGSCKICGGECILFDVADLNKCCSQTQPYQYGLAGRPVYYQRCLNCDFIFTADFDHWDHGAFSRHIYNDQYILVDGAYREVRPKQTAERFAKTFPSEISATILDYGSGTGIFEARLRKGGYQSVVSYDPFSNPALPSGKYQIVTCVEVMEHSPDPVATMTDIASFVDVDGVILFTTAPQPINIGSLRSGWWYIAPRNGHVSIYSLRALELIGNKLGLTFFQNRGAFHAFARSASNPCIKAMESLPTFSRTLWAPASSTDQAQWHNLERKESSSFRWTGINRVNWIPTLPIVPCMLHVLIPFCGEIRSDFAAESTITIGKHVLRPSVQSYNNVSSLVAQAVVEEPIEYITLETPEPIAGEKDRRRLGLAVAAGWTFAE